MEFVPAVLRRNVRRTRATELLAIAGRLLAYATLGALRRLLLPRASPDPRAVRARLPWPGR
ncbi:MAG: hypothetical protein L0216_14490 [Planctomycetales bacterium]|nr:hypothetical protein [Planctomycetales bacterium]